jgi:hypothetical protein
MSRLAYLYKNQIFATCLNIFLNELTNGISHYNVKTRPSFVSCVEFHN